MGSSSRRVRSKEVDKYLTTARAEARQRLREVRSAIWEAAPDAVESLSYGMPFYSFKGESGFEARLCYFGLLKRAIVFHTRPAFLEEYADELAPYSSTKSSLHFPLDGPLPVGLIKKLVRSGIRKHNSHTRS